MRIWCLLSWYDERADWLTEMVESVAPFVDGLIAVDGAYPLTGRECGYSHIGQYDALQNACDANGLACLISAVAWAEVEKRAAMFEAALQIAEPMVDWFLIMDGDMWMGENADDAYPGYPLTFTRWLLARTPCHAAEVTFHDPGSSRPFRSLFRAIPGLTVEGSHSTYTVPDFNGERLLMWQPIGDRQPVPALDLTKHVHLYHRPHLRDPDREALRADYYDRRATANIENVPEY